VPDIVEADFGTLSKEGDLSVLRFRRPLAHAPHTVWRALTEAGQLAAWFPTTIEGELVPGGPLVFSFRSIDLPPMHGEVLAVEADRLLEFMWGDDRLRLELQPGDGAGTTVLELTVWFPEHGKAARDGAGWHVCLDDLGSALAGVALAGEDDQHWREVHPGYVARLGPEASTVGRPPEWEDRYGPA